MTHNAVQEFHRELLEIAKLGIPLDLGFENLTPAVQYYLEHGSKTSWSTAFRRSSIETRDDSAKSQNPKQPNTPQQELSNFLDETASSIKHFVQDQPLNAETIGAIPDLPAKYRSALAIWLATEGSPIAFDLLTIPGVIRKQTRKLWNVSLLHPWMVFAISYVVMIYICSLTIPKLESIYEQTGHLPGYVSSMMFSLRKWRIVWIPVVPIVVAYWIYFRTRRTPTMPAKDWVGEKENELAMAAVASEQLAMLLQHDIELPKALEIVQIDPASLSAQDQDGASELEIEASVPSQSVPPIGSSGALLPMMQHALSLASVAEKVNALRCAAATYRSLANIRRARVRNWVPRLAMGLLGGTLVLGVGLSVFWPVAELLYDLAKPGGNR